MAEPGRDAPAAAPQSGLIVAAPQAEPVVGAHRLRLDPGAELGVPPHLTVLFPFLPPDRIDDGVLDRLARLFADVPGFDYRLDDVGWFGQDVVWLAPADPAPFRELTRRASEAFPQCPPYQGQHPDVVPHLTVGHLRPVAELRQAADAVRPLLPITDRAREVTLMVQEVGGGRWTRGATFPLC